MMWCSCGACACINTIHVRRVCSRCGTKHTSNNDLARHKQNLSFSDASYITAISWNTGLVSIEKPGTDKFNNERVKKYRGWAKNEKTKEFHSLKYLRSSSTCPAASSHFGTPLPVAIFPSSFFSQLFSIYGRCFSSLGDTASLSVLVCL